MEWQTFGRKAIAFIDTPIKDDARITVLEGSVRSGKTIAVLPKWLTYIKEGPPGLLAITGKSKGTIFDNVLRDMFDTVGKRNYSYNRQSGDLVVFGREMKVIGAKDEGSEEYLRGKTLAGALCDELTTMPESFFLQLLNRLSVEGSKLYGTTNPDSPYHYLFLDYITDIDKLKSGMVKALHFELDDNPSLSEEYKTFIRGAYSGLWYQRNILGLWVLAEGAIYDMFSEDRHVVTRDQLPKVFDKNLIGIDYGTANPTVFMKSGITNHKNRPPTFWHREEYYHDSKKTGHSKTTSQYKRDLVEFMGGRYDKRKQLIQQPDPYKIYVDPSALPLITELRSTSCGISLTKYVRKGRNEVSAGINSVATLMSLGRYKICKETCPNCVKETTAYLWDPKKQKIGEDSPIKSHDHTKDAERYEIHSELPATKVLMSYAAN